MPSSPVSLLLLPALTLPFQRSSLKAAYHPTLSSVFKKLKDGTSRLDVAIVLSHAFSALTPGTRASMFPTIQFLLEEYYRLICIVAAQEKVDLDFPGGVDARVFILDHSGREGLEDALGKQALCGPFVDLHTFAMAGRSYEAIYSVESEEGGHAIDALQEAYRAIGKRAAPLQRLPCGTSLAVGRRSFMTWDSTSRHHSVAVGGTFDHLHIGHKLLLSATIFLAEPSGTQQRVITVGTTGDELLVNKKYASQVESWDDRQAHTADFVESVLVFHPDVASIRKQDHIDESGPNGKIVRVTYGHILTINYTRISDPFGPTITDEEISALVISKETRAGGKAVNDKRTEKGWKALEVFEVDVLDPTSADSGTDQAEAKDTFESKISSTEIRRRLDERSKTTQE